jgi:hypothetical protein
LALNPKKENVRKLTIQCNPKGLRNIINAIGLNGGSITIDFLHNSYEVNFTKAEKAINKLYHQPLSKEEIEIITEILGNFFFDVIEQSIEAHKK